MGVAGDRHRRKKPRPNTLWRAFPGVVGWLGFVVFWFWEPDVHDYSQVRGSLIDLYYWFVVPVAAISGVVCAVHAWREIDGSAARASAAILVTVINLSFTGFVLWVVWAVRFLLF